MVRFIGFEADSLTDVLNETNAWITNRETQFKEEFRYIDIRFASMYEGNNIHYSIIVIYENLTNNEEIDKKSVNISP